MAEAFFNQAMEAQGETRFRAISAGTAPSDHPNPAVVAAMAEINIVIPEEPGRLLTPALSANAIKFVSMGCGDAEACPARLQGDMEDWDITDPKGKSVEEVRQIRADVKSRVDNLVVLILSSPECATN